MAIILAGVYFLQNSPANFTEPQITFDIEESQLPSIKTPSDSILNTANKTLEKITETSKNSSKTTKKAEQRHDALIPSGAVANQTSTTISGSDTPSNNSASEKAIKQKPLPYEKKRTSETEINVESLKIA